nr:MAG TPA: hypothetical protein [Bacteriophage sp.]
MYIITASNCPFSLSLISRWKLGRLSVLPEIALSQYSFMIVNPFFKAKS